MLFTLPARSDTLSALFVTAAREENKAESIGTWEANTK